MTLERIRQVREKALRKIATAVRLHVEAVSGLGLC
jgi:DNA-directed RNA polymerase sigma subunit (sigma70/sigma32)